MKSSARATDVKLPSVSSTSVPASSRERQLQLRVQSKLLPSEKGRNLSGSRREEAHCCLLQVAFPEAPCSSFYLLVCSPSGTVESGVQGTFYKKSVAYLGFLR